ncbi:hypothetical protein LCGC14_0816660 [marine sediment metagenome]|uniref:Phage capsid-like C-terminal domain-containing protein n=1 Tax=marine sediment metagenome TaxID=412755 RepID=A0A0F9PPT0_9ZZZZ
MSLIAQYTEAMDSAVTAANTLGGQISELLRDGKTLDDEKVVELNGQRTRAFTDADRHRELLHTEIRQEQAAAETAKTLEGYKAVGFVPPKGVAEVEQNRIEKIVTPSLRSVAIENPWLVGDSYREALNSYVKTSIRQNTDSLSLERFMEAQGLEYSPNVMETITDDLGGYTVPPDLQDQIIRNLATFSVFRQLAAVTPTSSNLVEWVTVQRASGNDKSIFTGTFVGSMVSETPAAAAGEQDLKFQTVQAPIRKSRVIGWIGEDLVADSMFDVLALVADEGAINLAVLEDKQFLLGNGANGEVMGILNNDDIGITDIDGGADTIKNTTTDRGSEEDILTSIDNIPAQYRVGPGVAVIGHSKTRTKIRGLVTPAGNFVWREELSVEILANGRAGSIEGIPFYMSDHMAQDGTAQNKVLIWGNFRHCRILDRQRLTVRVSFEQKFDVEQVGLRVNSRFGFLVTNPEPFQVSDV